MNINFGKGIAEKLGLTGSAKGAPIGDMSARQAALDKKSKSAWKGLTTLPSGYGRSIRRQRNRNLDSAAKKQRRAQFRNELRSDAFYDHAGHLARIYFGETLCRTEVRQRIIERVQAQVDNLVSTGEGISKKQALKDVEATMRSHMAEADQRAAARLAARQQAFLKSKRGEAVLADPDNVRSLRALDRRGLEIG